MDKQDIINVALRYVKQGEIVDFPVKGDVFYFLQRNVNVENWLFAGYAQCNGYIIDERHLKDKKWLQMFFWDFNKFPLVELKLALQPHQIATGKYQTPDRQQEIKMVAVKTLKTKKIEDKTDKKPDNIIKFPGVK